MDPNATCVKWATPNDQIAAYNSQIKQAQFMSIAGTFVLLGGIIMMIDRKRAQFFDKSIPLAISGTIALAMGVSVWKRSSQQLAYDTTLHNMLIAGWASLSAPITMFLIMEIAKSMTESKYFNRAVNRVPMSANKYERIY